MKRTYDENVLVIPRALFDEMGSFQGLSADVSRYLHPMFADGKNFFLDRGLAEDDPGHKQIIPYAIFRHGDKFLHYVRGGASGEQRLAAMGSIGIGGHINDTDGDSGSLAEATYLAGVDREIREELEIAGGFSQRAVAMINDDSTEVGQVHLGIVHLVDLDTDDVRSNEDSITELAFLSIEELKERGDRLETWSQICLSEIGSLVGG